MRPFCPVFRRQLGGTFSRLVVRPGLGFALLFCATGCLELGMGGNGSSGGGTDSEDSESGDGEGSCNDWKVAYCDALEECDAFSDREECENDVGYVVCKEDAPVAQCQTEIRAALREDSCSDLPGSECTPAKIADPTGAIAACEALHEEVCELQLYCGLTYTAEECMAELSAADPCANYYAVWPGIDPCIEAYPKLGCNDQLPDVCMGILRD